MKRQHRCLEGDRLSAQCRILPAHRYNWRKLLLAILCICELVSCAEWQAEKREKGAIAGGAIGAGLGAIVGSQTGAAGGGLAIGGVMGAAVGGLLGNEFDKQDDWIEDRSRQKGFQEAELADNGRLIQKLKAGGADARITERGVVINLPDVLFGFDKVDLSPMAEKAVREIAGAALTVPERPLSIEGHTDSTGNEEYNHRLSEQRARTVANGLAKEGVARKRIATRALGSKHPIATNESAAGRARNRRVEVIIERRA